MTDGQMITVMLVEDCPRYPELPPELEGVPGSEHPSLLCPVIQQLPPLRMEIVVSPAFERDLTLQIAPAGLSRLA